ncbi:MAG: glycosyltransferase family 39 protein [Planctomycetes bacterium]|nr:glycosyltransferase family 39 protein [Planctomycetota bacterium]
MEADRTTQRVLSLVIAITVARWIWIALDPIPVWGDEAQYWCWSRSLAAGYYSKPPLIAWVLAASTSVFGDGAFGVKFASPLFHAVAALALSGVARRLFDEMTALWTALVYLTLPAVSLSSAISSTDAPLACCWALALYGVVRAREDDRLRWWVFVGVVAGCGLLAKYAMAYFFGSAALWIVVDAQARRRRAVGLALAASIALVLLAPNLQWNARHGWLTLQHTASLAHASPSSLHPLELANFLAAQLGVFGPVLFVGLALLVARAWRASAAERLLAAFAYPTLAVVALIALFGRGFANWAAPAYLAATPLVVATLSTRAPRWLRVSTGLHVLAAVILVFVCAFGAPFRIGALEKTQGWSELGAQLGLLRARYPRTRLLFDDRLTMASLIYHVRPHPFDAVKWNHDGQIDDQFELVTDLASARGEDFLLVTEQSEPAHIEACFARAELAAELDLATGGGVRRVFVFALREFRGYR